MNLTELDGVEFIQASNNSGRQKIDALQIPFLKKLIERIESEQCSPDEVYGRWYQKSLITAGTFEVPSPWTGTSINASRSVLLNDKTVFYGFEKERDLWLGAGSIGEGSPINAIYIPSCKIFINLGHEVWGAKVEGLLMASRIVREFDLMRKWDHASIASLAVVAVTGDPSFAHHIWNQLGALDRLAKNRIARPRNLNFVVTHEPLGSLKEIFDECTNWAFDYCAEPDLEKLNSPSALFCPIGGRVITHDAVGRIFQYVDRQPDTERPRRVGGPPRFWISIRTRNRTLSNQVEFIVSLSAFLLDRYPGSQIVLDGHSYAEDNWRLINLGDNSNFDLVQNDFKVANEIREILKEYRQRILIAVGLKISQSLAIARNCDFYVCHHGTVQHKIGWFTSVPGVIHSNKKITMTNPASSVASQVENHRLLPVYLPAEYVEDIEAQNPPNALQAELRHDNYFVTNIPEVCKFIEHLIRASVPGLRTIGESRIEQMLKYFHIHRRQ